MRHSLRAVSLWWLIVLVPILAGAAPRNKAPIANNDAATTALDTRVRINVIANDRDRDGRIVRTTVRIVGGARHGRAATQRNGMVIYTPNPGFLGQDTFRYRVRDNRGTLSNRARVRVSVLPGARPPVANNDTAATAINTLVVINVVANDTDADGNLDASSVAIAANPASGGVVNNGDGTVTYTPSAGFFGTDAFAYAVRDSQRAPSNVATVTVTVNAGPVAEAGPDQNAVTAQPVTLNGSASSDPDGNTLAFSWRFLSIPPASARADADIVNPTSPAPSFTPDVDGDYELDLTVTDGRLSDTDGVVITAATGNVAPNAAAGPDQNADLGQTVPLDGRNSSDPDQGRRPLSFTWSFAQKPGGSILTNANIRNAAAAQASFVPDVIGGYVVTLAVSDGDLGDQDEVQINVTLPNVPPNADAGADLVVQLGPPPQTAVLNGTRSNDPDNGPVTPLTFQWSFVSVAPGSGLTNSNITNANTATPSVIPDVAGNYVLRLEVFDGEDTDSDQVMVTANRAPVANADSATTRANTPVLIRVVQNDTDSDGTIVPASVAIVGTPTNGTAVNNRNGTVTYTPTTNFVGTGSFRYTVNDNQGATSNTATVTITVQPRVNVPPVAVNDALSVSEDVLVIRSQPGVLGNDSDADGDPLTAVVVSGPSPEASFTLNPNGRFSYAPSANFNGADSFTYRANDGNANSNVATVTITVNPVNDVPAFTTGPDQTVIIFEGTQPQTQTVDPWATGISAGPANESGQTLTFITPLIINGFFSAGPSVSPGGVLTYTPAQGASGTATITLVLRDNGGTANGGADRSPSQSFTITVIRAPG